MDSFILRQINKENNQTHNQILGSGYSVLRKSEDPDNWKRAAEATGIKQIGGNHLESCWGFIEHGGSVWPLYTGFRYYIMSGSGSTFEKIDPH